MHTHVYYTLTNTHTHRSQRWRGPLHAVSCFLLIYVQVTAAYIRTGGGLIMHACKLVTSCLAAAARERESERDYAGRIPDGSCCACTICREDIVTSRYTRVRPGFALYTFFLFARFVFFSIFEKMKRDCIYSCCESNTGCLGHNEEY